MGLLAVAEFLCIVAGNLHDSEDLAFGHEFFRVGHVGAAGVYLYRGRGRGLAYEIARSDGHGLVDDCHGEFAYDFGVVDEGIDHGIGQRQCYEEEEHARVFDYMPQLAAEHATQSGEPIPDVSECIHTMGHKRDLDMRS